MIGPTLGLVTLVIGGSIESIRSMMVREERDRD